MRRGGIANVGHTRIAAAPLQRKGRRRHAPPGHRQFPTVGSVPHDRGIVGKDAGQGRKIGGSIVHGPRQFTDRLPIPDHRVKVAHNVGVCCSKTDRQNNGRKLAGDATVGDHADARRQP
jgi:hypothetical protein